MRNKMLLLVFIFSTGYVSGTIRNVPSAYVTIQSALSICILGDTVLVQPGMYHENIIWPSVNAIVLMSAGDSSNTIIDGNAANRVITFNGGGIDTATVIHGFKITNGRLTGSYAYGGGVYFSNASPKIIECSITANRLDSTAQWCYGAGVYCSYSSPVFRRCSIANNITQSSSWAYGGGVHCTYNSNAVFYECLISNNSITGNGWAYGAGIYMTQNSSPHLTNTIISGNHSNDQSRCYGGGLYAESGSSPVLTNVLITGNIMEGNAFWYYGGGVYFTGSGTNAQMMNVTIADNVRDNGGVIAGSGLYADYSSSVTITNSVSWNNNTGVEMYIGTATVNMNYSCVRNGYTGTGNISSNPMFTSASDYHLQITSPCINAGTPAGAPSFDLENNPRPQPALTNPDMGCYEMDQTITGFDNPAGSSLSVNIYPNPVVNEMLIMLSTTDVSAENFMIEIYDGHGRQVLSGQRIAAGLQPAPVDLSDLQSGIYFCRVFSGEKTSTVKVVKQ